MSKADLSIFKWPTAAPGAPNRPKETYSESSLGTTKATATFSPDEATLHISLVTQSAGSIMASSADQTVHITVTSTILYSPATDASNTSMVHQTKSFNFHTPVIRTRIRTPVPEVTVASFDLFTPPADPPISNLAEPTPTDSNSSPTPHVSSSPAYHPASSPSALSPSAIAGTTLGLVAFVGILIALTVYRCRLRKAKKTQTDTEAAELQDTLEEKMAQARYLRQNRKRWSPSETVINKERFDKLKAGLAAKTGAAVVEEHEAFAVGYDEDDGKVEKMQVQYDRARRPSGLAMHPPTPAWVEEKDDGSIDIGRAM